jgi:hypothetical protein
LHYNQIPDIPISCPAVPGRNRRRAWQSLLLVSLVVTAMGCAPIWPPERQAPAAPQPAPVAAPEPEPEPEPEAPAELSAQDQQTIRNLLEQAYWAIAADRLTSPYQGSALSAYDEVLRIQPDNDEAVRGRERIVERFLEQALAAAGRRNLAAAQGALDQARLVDPDHPGVEPTQTQINLINQANRRVVSLDPAKLRDQHADAAAVLRQAGAASRAGDCRAEIFARSDAEGRWMYQQMSSGGGKRISAQLNIGSPPRVELLCFNGAR